MYCWVAFILVLAYLKPPLHIPLNDDWVYLLDSIESSNNKSFSISGMESAWGIPQILIGWAIHNYFPETFVSSSHIVSLFIFLGSLIPLTLFLRIYYKNVDLLPVYLAYLFFTPSFYLSFTFMTDVLYLLFLILSLYFIERGLLYKKIWFVFIAAIFTLLAISQRQFGVFVAVSAVVCSLYYNFTDSKRRLFWQKALLISTLPVITTILIFIWWKQLAGFSSSAPTLVDINPKVWIRSAHGILALIGMLAFGIILSYRAKVDFLILKNKLFIFISVSLLALTGLRFLFDPHAPFLTNLISQYGIFTEKVVLLGTRLEYLTPPIRVLLSLIFFGSFIYLLMIKNSHKLKLSRLKSSYHFGSITILSTLLYLGSTIFRGVFFDRYFIPALPLAFLFLLFPFKNSQKKSFLSVAMASVPLILFSTILMKDYFSWTHAKWTAAQWTKSNFPGALINGGYEWNGWNGFKKQAHPTLIPQKEFQYIIAFSPIDSFRQIREFPWSSILPPNDRKIYVNENLNFISPNSK